MREIPEVTLAEFAFPATPPGLPAWDEIPDEFKKSHGNAWVEVVEVWFNSGWPDGWVVLPREGVDPKKAFIAMAACLQSFEPKHEHKIAGVAFMLSDWFSTVFEEDTDELIAGEWP